MSSCPLPSPPHFPHFPSHFHNPLTLPAASLVGSSPLNRPAAAAAAAAPPPSLPPLPPAARNPGLHLTSLRLQSHNQQTTFVLRRTTPANHDGTDIGRDPGSTPKSAVTTVARSVARSLARTHAPSLHWHHRYIPEEVADAELVLDEVEDADCYVGERGHPSTSTSTRTVDMRQPAPPPPPPHSAGVVQGGTAGGRGQRWGSGTHRTTQLTAPTGVERRCFKQGSGRPTTVTELNSAAYCDPTSTNPPPLPSREVAEARSPHR